MQHRSRKRSQSKRLLQRRLLQSQRVKSALNKPPNLPPNLAWTLKLSSLSKLNQLPTKKRLQSMRRQIVPQTVQLKVLHQLLHQRLCHVLATIHFQQVARFRVHHVLATIHFQQVAQFRVHRSDLRELELHDQE